MEKLRAKWTIEMVKHHKTATEAENMNDPETASEHGGISDAYEQVIRDTDAYNEYLSTVIAEVTEKQRQAEEHYHIALHGKQMQDIPHLGDKAEVLREIRDKLHKLQYMKEVRT